MVFNLFIGLVKQAIFVFAKWQQYLLQCWWRYAS